MSTPTDDERCPKCHIAYECGCDCTPTDEPRELARRWAYNEAGMPVYGSEAIADPEPLDDPERERLFAWVREWMERKRMNNDIEADLGEVLGLDVEDAHALAEAAKAGPS